MSELIGSPGKGQSIHSIQSENGVAGGRILDILFQEAMQIDHLALAICVDSRNGDGDPLGLVAGRSYLAGEEYERTN